MKTWEFALYMFLFLTLVGLAQDQPDERDDPSSRCMKPDVAKLYGPAPWTILPCECHQECIPPDPDNGILEPWVREDPMCRKWCRKDLCLCHHDENTCELDVKKKP